jgi:hypothetical protein
VVRAAVDPEDDLGIENCEKGVEVAAVRGGQEGVANFPLTCEIDIGNGGCSLPALRSAMVMTEQTMPV